MSVQGLRPNSQFAWALARFLRVLGKAWVRWIADPLLPKTSSVQVWRDRFLHLNQAVGDLIPSLTHVVSYETLQGSRLAFRPFTDDADRVSNHYEQIARQLLSPQPSDVIVDVGANIGIHTIWLAKKVGPSGLILAIEPERNNYAILETNRRINHLANVIPIRVSLSSHDGIGRLSIPKPTSMGQVRTSESTSFSNLPPVDVRLQTLDNLISSQGVKVFAIKIDVEGTELSVLQGANDTIRTFRPRLLIEVHGKQRLSPVRASLHSLNMIVVSEVPASSRPQEERRFLLAIPDTKHPISSSDAVSRERNTDSMSLASSSESQFA